MPWLTSKSCALELASNSTGNVIREKIKDDPKRMTPDQARVGKPKIIPPINSHGATFDANCTAGSLDVCRSSGVCDR